MRRAITWWDTRQVPLYLAAIIAGAAVGLAFPQLAPALALLITPVLALLLFATFLAVPLIEVGRSFRDIRFLTTVLVVNFVFVPVLVFALSRFVADDQGLLIGVLLVLLTPCVDYVIVFTGLAGGAASKLLAASPLLMLLQIVLLPLYLWLFAGADAVELIEVGPFVEAFVVLIVVPLVLAAVVQGVGRGAQGREATGRDATASATGQVGPVRRGATTARAARSLSAVMAGAMVPLMMLTLAVVIGSQIAAVGSEAAPLLRLVPIYVVFIVVMVAAGLVASRVARLPVASARALIFSGVTRNSLVVLPLALALPAALGIAPLAVVTQTLVELGGMVVLVKFVPRFHN